MDSTRYLPAPPRSTGRGAPGAPRRRLRRNVPKLYFSGFCLRRQVRGGHTHPLNPPPYPQRKRWRPRRRRAAQGAATGYPDDNNFFELGFCGHTQFPHSKIVLDQASDLILSQFQEEYHPFIRKALQDEDIHLVSLYYVYKPKTDTPRTKNTEDDENAYKFGPKYGGESTGLHRHMISVVMFSYS